MTDKKQMTEKEILASIQAVISEIINAKNTLKTSPQMINDIVPVIVQGLCSKSFSKVADILFQKSGKISFYATYLRAYFRACHVMLDWNTRKKCFEWFGDFRDLEKLSYLEYLEQEKQYREKEKASLTSEQKLDKTFSKLDSLSKKDLEYIAKKVNNLLHKKT